MNGNYDYYNIYLSEEERINLQLNWNNKTVMMYLDNNKHLIISANRIPSNFKFNTFKTKLIQGHWVLPLPAWLVPSVNRKLFRYAITPITADKQTYQVIQISARLFIKEKKYVRITPVSKRRCKQIKTFKCCGYSKSTKNRKDPYIFDTLSGMGM